MAFFDSFVAAQVTVADSVDNSGRHDIITIGLTVNNAKHLCKVIKEITANDAIFDNAFDGHLSAYFDYDSIDIKGINEESVFVINSRGEERHLDTLSITMEVAGHIANYLDDVVKKCTAC